MACDCQHFVTVNYHPYLLNASLCTELESIQNVNRFLAMKRLKCLLEAIGIAIGVHKIYDAVVYEVKLGCISHETSIERGKYDNA